MTCIVAVKDEDGVAIGGDRCLTTGKVTLVSRTPKVKQFTVESVSYGASEPILVGLSGHVRVLNVFLNEWHPPQRRADVSDEWYIRHAIAETTRKWFETRALCVPDKDGWPQFDGEIIVGYRDELYLIDKYFGMSMPIEGYTSGGAGYAVAMGSLHSTGALPAQERVRKALEAAASHVDGVCGPFDILTIKSAGYLMIDHVQCHI